MEDLLYSSDPEAFWLIVSTASFVFGFTLGVVSVLYFVSKSKAKR